MRLLLAALFIPLILLIAGCAQAPPGQNGTNNTNGTPTAPSFSVTAPSQGATVAQGDVDVTIASSNFNLAAPGGSHVPNQGHYRLYLDNGNFVSCYSMPCTISDVEPGSHTLRVEAYTNANMPYAGVAPRTITFTVMGSTNGTNGTGGSNGTNGTVCTLDAMQCPDGSYVGRNPANNCQFFPCPGTNGTNGTGGLEGENRVVFAVAGPAPATGQGVNGSGFTEGFTGMTVTINSLEVHSEERGWVSLLSSPRTFDLSQMKASDYMLLADANLESGLYDEARLTLGSVQVTGESGTANAYLPATSLSLTGGFRVPSSSDSAIALRFVPERSLYVAQGGQYVVAPAITLTQWDSPSISSQSGGSVLISGIPGFSTEFGTNELGEFGPGIGVSANYTFGLNGTMPPGPNGNNSTNGTGFMVEIENFYFSPGAIAVPAGANVTWYNDGGAMHSATSATNGSYGVSAGHAEYFDSGVMMYGESYSRAFTTPGTYEYYCTIHPDMRGTVTVVPAGDWASGNYSANGSMTGSAAITGGTGANGSGISGSVDGSAGVNGSGNSINGGTGAGGNVGTGSGY